MNKYKTIKDFYEAVKAGEIEEEKVTLHGAADTQSRGGRCLLS